jgi:hypothetical protein
MNTLKFRYRQKKLQHKKKDIAVEPSGILIEQLLMISNGYAVSKINYRKLLIIHNENNLFNSFSDNLDNENNTYEVFTNINFNPNFFIPFSDTLIPKLISCIKIHNIVNESSYFLDYDNTLTNYYSIALNYVEDAIIYVLNDIDNYIEGDDIIKVNNLDDREKINIMLSCKKGGICGNNYESWWGTYLNTNKDKKIIVPKNWLNNSFNLHNSIIINNDFKYFLSIGALFKNEAHILKEWIEHYLYHGVDHIYLINDNSTDEYLSILNPYIESEKVTLFNNNFTSKHIGRQELIYNKYLMPEVKYSNWFCLVDLDEFLYSPKEVNIKKIITSYCNYSELRVSWNIFGSNELISQPNSVVESFIRCEGVIKNNIKGIKSIVKTNNLKGFKIHSHIIKGDYIHLDQDIMIVNHYNVQSLEFYITVKMTRGDSNNYIKRNLKIFKWNDINNIIDTKLYEQNKNMINDIKEKNNKITILYDSKNIINFENDINLIDKYIHKYDQCLIYNYGSSANFIYKPKIKYVNINNIDYYLYNRNIIECDSLTIDILLK